jgi:hypothetical protein
MPEQASQHPIPIVTQYATPGLIYAIAYQGHPAGDDPGWRASGAPDQQTYAHWCRRWCGMACLRMALIARDGTSTASRTATATRSPTPDCATPCCSSTPTPDVHQPSVAAASLCSS